MMENFTRDYMLQMANEISRLRAENEKLQAKLDGMLDCSKAYDAMAKLCSETEWTLKNEIEKLRAENEKLVAQSWVVDGALLSEREENEKLRADVALWAHKRMAHDSRLIERLRAENEKLRAALRPFADVADEHLCESDTGQIWDAEIASHITFDALRAAAAALKETRDE